MINPNSRRTRILLTGLKRSKDLQVLLTDRPDLFRSVEQVAVDSIEASISEGKSMEDTQDMNEVIDAVVRCVHALDETAAEMGTFTE